MWKPSTERHIVQCILSLIFGTPTLFYDGGESTWDNIKMDHKEIVHEGMDRIHLTQDISSGKF
jgi:hypothetical protein